MMFNFGVLLLAAGFSQRMGHMKPLLRLGEKTFIEYILSNSFMKNSNVYPLVVLGYQPERVRNVLPDSIPYVINEKFSQGRMTSVQSGLRALPDSIDGVFVWPVDCPLVPSDILHELAKAFESRSMIVIPSYQYRRGHPPLIGAQYFREMLSFEEQQSLRDLYTYHVEVIMHVNVESETILHNINTPEDYEKIKSTVGVD